MEFFRIRRTIPFMRHSLVLNLISLGVFVAAVFFIATRGFNLSIEFTGGTVMEVSYPQAAQLEEVRSAVGGLGYTDFQVQNFGTSRDVMIRLPVREGETSAMQSEAVLGALQATSPDVELRRVEFVGPQVGDELRDQSGLAVLMAMIMMMLYIWFRFSNKFGVATLLALVHDVIVVLGAFALFRWPFDLTVLAAVLAVVGYSINDTIVIADHIREDFRNSRLSDTRTIINRAITRTLSRTMITSL
ncbi:MAG TPA: protein translocase subunit SecF, partial [Pusillimonas sp.]|uniref:protein translocase subunit SecF n=1 Tax=Pusillimonas sp. TaxID=3040095 RepID=UPI002B4ACB60